MSAWTFFLLASWTLASFFGVLIFVGWQKLHDGRRFFLWTAALFPAVWLAGFLTWASVKVYLYYRDYGTVIPFLNGSG